MKHRVIDVLIGIGIGVTITFAFTVKAERVTYTAPEEPLQEPQEVLIEVRTEWTEERIKQEVLERSKERGVSYDQVWNTIMCESHGSTTVQSKHRRPDGTREQSFGLVQIHLPAHPNVSYEEAIDPEFAIQFIVENFAAGRQRMWTCWRQLYE